MPQILLILLILPFTPAAFAAKVWYVSKVCQGDVLSVCKHVVSGRGRIFSCLRKRADEISTDCLEHLDEFTSKNPDFEPMPEDHPDDAK